MSLEVWRRNSQLLYYYDICCYQFGAWQNCASRETKPGEASYRPLVMDSVLQWLLCLILPLTILISLKLCQSFVLSLGSKREKSLATPMFQVLLCGCATQSGTQEGGWKQSTCLHAWKLLEKLTSLWEVSMLIGCASLVICFSQIASANEASFFFFSINLIWMPSNYLRIFYHQQSLAASSNSPKTSNFGSCL